MTLSQIVLPNLDWLAWSVRLSSPEPIFVCPPGQRLEMLPGNNIFARRAILYNQDGEKLLTMLWHPHSSLIDPMLMTVQASNWSLYDIFYDYMELLRQVVDCDFNSMSRIDVCMDFVPDSRQMKIIRKLAAGSAYVQGKREGSVWWHDSEFKGTVTQFPHCLSWGSKCTAIRSKLYFKSRELGLLSGDGSALKPYIVAEWQHYGLDVKCVWRLEFSITSASEFCHEGRLLTLDEVMTWDWIHGVASAMLNRRFVVRERTGARSRGHNDDPILQFLKFDRDAVYLRKREREARAFDPSNVKLLRTLLRQLESPLSLMSDSVFNSLAESVAEVVASAHLDSYFQAKFGMTPSDYCCKVYESGGTGIVAKEPDPSFSWD